MVAQLQSAERGYSVKVTQEVKIAQMVARRYQCSAKVSFL